MSAPTDLTELSLAEASELLLDREISAVEITRAYLERIESVEPVVRAFATLVPERALEDAEVAEKELARGQRRGALHGIPIALKDIVATEGIPTRAGSRVLNDWVPSKDATVAAKLKAAGSVLLGKATTHEFAMDVYTPPTRNPWSLDRIPGGSSGGSASAVASRLCLGAIGTDTAGSIRIPASLCGVTGLKPTYGRVSRAGVVPFSWSLDHVGPLARTALDVALILEVIAGPDSDDATTIRAKSTSYANTVGASVAGIKVGVPREFFFENVNAAALRGAETAIETLASLGLVMEEISLPTAHLAQTVGDFISFPEASLYHRRWLRERRDDYSPSARANLVVGETLLATDYLQAQRVRTIIVSEALQVLDGVEMIATPTTPIQAIRPDETMVSFSTGAPETVLDAYCRLTYLANVTGLPALSVPCGFSADGLPLGLQLIGRPLGEARLLQVGAAYQGATDWHLRHPTGLEKKHSPDARITANGE